jgi:hypothetical protein
VPGRGVAPTLPVAGIQLLLRRSGLADKRAAETKLIPPSGLHRLRGDLPQQFRANYSQMTPGAMLVLRRSNVRREAGADMVLSANITRRLGAEAKIPDCGRRDGTQAQPR